MKKILFFISIAAVLMVVSCNKEEKRVVKERYSDGKEKIVISFKGDTTHMVQYLEIHPSGKIAREIEYEANGVNRASERYIYEDGEVKLIGVYKNDHRFGVWKAFFPGGELQSIRNYNEDGKEEGLSQVYKLENGHYFLYLSGYFSNGEKRGTWKFYNRDGDIIKTLNY